MDERQKRLQAKRIEDSQRKALAELKVFNKDFYDKLPDEIREIMWRLIDRWSEYDWFDRAWAEYRKHVLEASEKGHKIKAPGFIFNKFIGKQVAENIKKEDSLWESDEMKVLHSEEFLEDCLKHYGIKGQKWGVRRYQNEDGTLTEAGKARYNENGTLRDPASMTDEELRKANMRIQAEQQYQNLTGTSQPSRALTRDNAIKIGATFVGTATLPVLYKALTNKLPKASNKKGVRDLVIASLISGGIGALISTASSFGGEAKNIQPPGNKDKNDK